MARVKPAGWALITIVIVGLVIRALAASTDFWLDEIWSWRSAMSIHSWVEVFTGIHDDNNHYLNTLWMFLLGKQSNWFLYRLPAIFAGAGSVLLMGLIGLRRSTFTGIAAAVMGCFSYMLVLYSSEARGFAQATFFSLVCLYQMLRYFDTGRTLNRIVFCVSAVCGLLSQLTFIYVYLGLMVLGCVEEYKRKKNARAVWAHFFAFHFTTWLAWAVVGNIDLVHLKVGGGPRVSLIEAFCAACALVLGAPLNRYLPPLLALPTLIVALWEIVRQRKEHSQLWLFYLMSLTAGPILCMFLAQTRFVYPRHLVICVPILLLVLADFLTRIRAKRSGRKVAVALLAVFVSANVWKTCAFLKEGRGQYLRALSYVAERSGGSTSMASSHDFQTMLMLSFYNQYLPGEKQVVYVTRDEASEKKPEWFLYTLGNVRTPDGAFMGPQGDFRPAETVQLPYGQYALDNAFLHSSDVSGSHWLLYKRQ